jgi:hypothetical protein
MKTNGTRYLLLVLSAAVCWGALLLQADVSFTGMLARGLSVSDAFIRFFSYFTILTNSFIAVDCTVLLITGKSRWSESAAHASLEGCLAVSIFFVSMGYTILLRHLLHLVGVPLLANSLLHYAVPSLFLLFWFLFAPAHKLTWKHSGWWVLYPLAYFIYALVQGWRTGLYPYPFIDARHIGYSQTLINGGILLVLFWMGGVAFVALLRALHRSPRAVSIQKP